MTKNKGLLTLEELLKLVKILGDCKKMSSAKIINKIKHNYPEDEAEVLIKKILNTKKNQRIELRCDAQDKISWLYYAIGLDKNLTEYITDAVNNRKVDLSLFQQSKYANELLRSIFMELNAIGRNVNQLTKWCNTYQEDVNRTEIMMHLFAIELAMATLPEMLIQNTENMQYEKIRLDSN